MTELEQYRPRTLEAVPVHAPGALPIGASNVRAWVETYTYAAEFAACVVDTPFVPDSYRPKIDPRASAEEREAAREIAIATAATAIVYGAGIGFDNPVQALQNVYVVKGRPALYADAMVAVVQAAGHEIWVEELTDSRAVVCGRRRGGREERVVVTMDQARKAGWTSRNDNYSKDPQAMLYARAAGRLCKRIAQAELKGFVTMEEIADGDEDELEAAAPRTVARTPLTALPSAPAEPETAAAEPEKPKARATRKRAAPAPRPTGEQGPPPLPGEDAPAAAPAAPAPAPAAAPPLPAELVTHQQLTAISSRFAALGLVERDECRSYVERVLDRPVADPAKMTSAEADTVIAAMDAQLPQEAAPEEDEPEQGTLGDDGPDES